MKKNIKFLIISLIIFLCIVLLILILLIFKTVKKDDNFDIYDNTTNVNSMDLADIDSTEPQDSERPFDNIKEVIDGKNNENVNQINRTDQNLKTIDESINSIKISLENVSKEIQNSIKDKDNFIYSIKKFIYEQNLIDGDILTLTSSKIEDNKLIMYFKMNDNRKSTLEIIYNMANNMTGVFLIINNE